MRIERQLEYVLTGLGLALALILAPAVLPLLMADFPSLWLVAIALLSAGTLFLGLQMYLYTRRLCTAEERNEPLKTNKY